jgi:hypothetical protein
VSNEAESIVLVVAAQDIEHYMYASKEEYDT